MSTDTTATIDWLKKRSMLLKYQPLVESLSGSSAQWRHPFGYPQAEAKLADCSVWFAAYPDSLIGRQGENALDILGAEPLLNALAEVGIEAIHTGPMKRSGSISGSEYRPSIDGHFDRIESLIDPEYGSEEQYRNMVAGASQSGIRIIGDLVPGHTGMGPDFRLAELNVPGFPGLYTMFEIDPEHWPLLPGVPAGQDSVNLSQSELETLKQQGYELIGPLDTEVFARPGIKESCWSTTGAVTGVDGKERRWVYLHIFKQGQPSLNWSDPSFGAHRLMTADMLHSLHLMGATGLRLDATMFLGIESRPEGKKSWLAGHPLSTQVTDLLGMMIRKFGGFSFQELNIDLDKLQQSLPSGPEFNYDFVTRPAYLYALATGDAGPLRLMLRQLLQYGIPPKRMVHGLQNHDELMLETTHLSVNGGQVFHYEGCEEDGRRLFDRIHRTVTQRTVGDAAPYNRVFAMSPGVCSTLAGFIAATLKISDLADIGPSEIEQIRRRHLLAAAVNGLQGGVFVLSGWDLVGALPVSIESVQELVADNDHRWINRGGYDLLGVADDSLASVQGLPRARSLYGSLSTQLEDPASFACLLRSMLELRNSLAIAKSDLLAVPKVDHDGLVVLINDIGSDTGAPEKLQITAANFGDTAIAQRVEYPGFGGQVRALWSNLDGSIDEEVEVSGQEMMLELMPQEARLLIVSDE